MTREVPAAGGGPLVKICGVTRLVDATHAASAGADFIGLNFWPRSKRHVHVELAADLAAATRAAATPTRPLVVGVFVDAEIATIEDALVRVHLDIVQLHGTESAATIAAVVALGVPVWRALAIATEADLDALSISLASSVAAILLDTGTGAQAGSGAAFDWTLAALARVRHPNLRILLAGGLTRHNVARAIAAASPYAVDVASGVESAPGIKDPAAVTAFIATARGATRSGARRS